MINSKPSKFVGHSYRHFDEKSSTCQKKIRIDPISGFHLAAVLMCMEAKHAKKGRVMSAVLPKIKLCSALCFIDMKRVPGGGE